MKMVATVIQKKRGRVLSFPLWKSKQLKHNVFHNWAKILAYHHKSLFDWLS